MGLDTVASDIVICALLLCGAVCIAALVGDSDEPV
jgi:hypothetical protein